MVQINFAQKQINAKIVYYGPGMSGKTTNLEVVHQRAPAGNRGELTSISTDGDRTLFFDYMPLELGTIAGMKTCFQMYTVPGQVYYNSTRKLVLQGVDGVIFVADSSAAGMEANLESLRNLEENLNEYGKSLATMPHVIQYNKRDLPDALPVEELEAELNHHGAPTFEAVAATGEGVFPTLKGLAAAVLKNIQNECSGGLGRTGFHAPPAARPVAAPPAAQAPPAAPARASSGEAQPRPALTSSGPQPRPGAGRSLPASTVPARAEGGARPGARSGGLELRSSGPQPRPQASFAHEPEVTAAPQAAARPAAPRPAPAQGQGQPAPPRPQAQRAAQPKPAARPTATASDTSLGQTALRKRQAAETPAGQLMQTPGRKPAGAPAPKSRGAAQPAASGKAKAKPRAAAPPAPKVRAQGPSLAKTGAFVVVAAAVGAILAKVVLGLF